MTVPEGTVTIPLAEYMRLKSDSVILSLLEASGVRNWEGYEDALTYDG